MRRLILLTSPIALMLAAGPVRAEPMEEPQQTTQLGEIEVIGAAHAPEVAKTGASVEDTPQAISVITAEQFEQYGALTLQETLRYTAGVSAEAYGNDGRNDYSFVRDVEAPIYLDGLRQTYGYYAPRTDIFMLEQVEVLKGPGGSLYGAGTVGGLINQTSKRPEFAFGGEVGASYGSFDRIEIQGDVTGPLNAAGTLAGRLIVVGRDSGTQTDYVDDDRAMVAPSVTWRPDAKTSLTVIGRYQADRGATISTFVPIAASLLAPEGRRLPSDRFLSEPDFEKYDTTTKAISALFTREVASGVTFRSNSRYLASELDYQGVYPNSYDDPANPWLDAEKTLLGRYIFATYGDLETFSTDNNVQARFTTGAVRHSLLAGVDWSWYTEETSGFSDLTTPINAYDPVYGNYTLPDVVQDPDIEQTQLGFYLQDTLSIGEDLSVLLGVRRDRAVGKLEGSDDQTDEATTFRAAVMYDLPHGLAPYVSYSESFQPTPGVTFDGEPFKPTEGRQWELGAKWRLSPTSLLTAAVYHITESNRLTNDPIHPFDSIQTGEAELQGAEFEADIAVGPYQINGALTFTESEITESTIAGEVGLPLEAVPERLASVFVTRAFALSNGAELRVGGGVRYTDESYSGALRTPSATLGDLYAALDWRDWTVALNGSNVTDKDYYATCLQRGDCFLGVRRNVSLSVTRRF